MIRSTCVLATLAAAFCTCSEAAGQALDDFLDDATVELAEGYDKRLRYTPSTVTVLDHAYIERTGALDLAELLERVVGIHVGRRSFGSNTDPFVRGIDGNLLVLRNGVQIARLVPEPLAMPLVDVRRVETAKGSHYPLHGASATVGTVNAVTWGRKDKRLTSSDACRRERRARPRSLEPRDAERLFPNAAASRPEPATRPCGQVGLLHSSRRGVSFRTTRGIGNNGTGYQSHGRGVSGTTRRRKVQFEQVITGLFLPLTLINLIY